MPNRRTASFAKTLLRGEAQSGVWNAVSRVLGMVNAFFIISALTVYQYGVLQLLLSVYTVAAETISLGVAAVDNDVQRFEAEGKAPEAKRLFVEYAGVRIVIALLFWAVFFFGAPLLAFRYAPDFINIIRMCALLFLGEALVQTAVSLARMRLNFAAVAAQEAIGKMLQLAVLGYFFAARHIGVREVLISLVASSAIALAYLVPVFVRAYEPWGSIVMAPRGALTRLIATHGKWEFLRHFVARVFSRAEVWVIKVVLNTEAVGIYSVALTMVNALKNLVATNTLTTLMANRGKEKAMLASIVVRGTKYMVFAGAAVALAGALVLPVIVHRVFPVYAVALPLVYLLLTELPIYGGMRVIDALLTVQRHQKFIFLRTLLRGAALLILFVALLPAFGLWGAVGANVLAAVFAGAFSYAFVVRRNSSYEIDAGILFSWSESDRMFLKTILRALVDRVKRLR